MLVWRHILLVLLVIGATQLTRCNEFFHDFRLVLSNWFDHSPFTNIRKMVQTAVKFFFKLFRCIASWYTIIVESFKSIQQSILLKIYVLRYLFIPFEIIYHISWIIDLPSNRNGPVIPRESSTELRTLRRLQEHSSSCQWLLRQLPLETQCIFFNSPDYTKSSFLGNFSR